MSSPKPKTPDAPARMMRTYHGRVVLSTEAADLLGEYATRYGRAERRLFVLVAKGGDPGKAKPAFMREHGLRMPSAFLTT